MKKQLTILLALFFFISCDEQEVKPSEREFIVFGQDTIVVEGRFNTYVSKTRFGSHGFFDSTLNGYVIEVKQEKDIMSRYDLILVDNNGNVDTIQGIDESPAIVPQIDTTKYVISINGRSGPNIK